jgi:hypothetical protein
VDSGWQFHCGIEDHDDVKSGVVKTDVVTIDEWRVTVEAVGNEGSAWEYMRRERGPELRSSGGGRYRITQADVAGFDTVAPLELDVVEGEVGRHEVRFVRKP